MFQKKKKDFWGVLEPFLIVKKVLKFVLIKDSDKMGVWLLGGIVLVLVARLLRGYFKITFPLITLKKPPLKSRFFILS
ncbi:hypothetical protein KVC56_05915 [Helicobacter pylori]|nr:hypothetical protein KVC56_05915 [Helicobacter pylori]